MDGLLAALTSVTAHRKLGRYVQTGTGKWKEIPKSPDGTTFHFNETNRDMWSVYLHDPSRNVRIQIDLHTRKIYYSDPQAPKREQYAGPLGLGKLGRCLGPPDENGSTMSSRLRWTAEIQESGSKASWVGLLFGCDASWV